MLSKMNRKEYLKTLKKYIELRDKYPNIEVFKPYYLNVGMELEIYRDGSVPYMWIESD